jgi:hypothetical protein
MAQDEQFSLPFRMLQTARHWGVLGFVDGFEILLQPVIHSSNLAAAVPLTCEVVALVVYSTI